MKSVLLASAIAAVAASGAMAASHAKEVKLGILIGFTGPIESLTESMAKSAEAAIAEVNAAGGILDGMMVSSVRGDTGCTDAGLATSTGEKMVTGDGVAAIIGGDCSGVTGAILQNVAIPNGILMISPSATSPALSTVESGGLFFRTAPSDAREGVIAAQVMKDRGITSAALTYTNNDYGKGLADAIKTEAEAAGIKITTVAAHEDGKADYSAEVGALASAGGDILIVAGYLDQGGLGIIKAALDSGAFDTFELPGGMIGESLAPAVGDGLNGSFGQVPGSDSPGMEILNGIAAGTFDINSPYTPESYDAAALILLGMQAAGSTDGKAVAAQIEKIANGPGEKILPGELAKGLQILKDGGTIDYEGATAVTLVNGRDGAGRYREIEVKDGKMETVGFR
jgi:branched-chain amino acid transport system substrate-binding protein